ncbi:TPA: glycosyltransferase [Pseudomonas putida]
MNFTSQAKAAFDAGNYQTSLDLYHRAILEQPELASIYLITINIVRGKIGLGPLNLQGAQNISAQNSPKALHPGFQPKTAENLDSLYDHITNYLSSSNNPKHEDIPLASIIMTAKDCERTIEEAITSILRQSWTNSELIIIDNGSTDATWRIIQRIQATVSNIKSRKNNMEIGELAAKNIGLELALGQFIFFQDASDFCHPNRIEICMHHFRKTNAPGLFGMSRQIKFAANDPVPVDKAHRSSELSSMAFKRDVIEEIGLLSEAHNQSDDKILDRIYGWSNIHNDQFHNIDLPLYYKVILQPPPQQFSYATAYSPCNSTPKPQPPTHEINQLPVSEESNSSRYLTAAPVPDPTFPPVVVSLCSIPQRAALLRQTVKSLASQVDAFYIYLDNYDHVPDFLRGCHPQMTIFRSAEHPKLRDNGKFLAFPTLSKNCYYFTADDDIIYPPDYVCRMVQRIETYERQAVIGVHGVLLPEQAEGYFSAFRKVHMFTKRLERDALVNNLGTGTVAFHSSLLRGLDLTHFGTPGMADLHLSVLCKQRDIPMIALARPEGWLQELPSPNTSLYNEFRQADDQQSALIRAHKPWGYAAISKAVAGASMRATQPDTGERLQRLIPLLHACLK